MELKCQIRSQCQTFSGSSFVDAHLDLGGNWDASDGGGCAVELGSGFRTLGYVVAVAN